MKQLSQKKRKSLAAAIRAALKPYHQFEGMSSDVVEQAIILSELMLTPVLINKPWLFDGEANSNDESLNCLLSDFEESFTELVNLGVSLDMQGDPYFDYAVELCVLPATVSAAAIEWALPELQKTHWGSHAKNKKPKATSQEERGYVLDASDCRKLVRRKR